LNDIGKTKIHTAEPLEPEPTCFGDEIAIAILKIDKSPGINKIPAQMIQTGGNIFGIRKNCHSSGRNLLLYLLMERAGGKTDCSNYRQTSLLLFTLKNLIFFTRRKFQM
jgi:hypothetical protein